MYLHGSWLAMYLLYVSCSKLMTSHYFFKFQILTLRYNFPKHKLTKHLRNDESFEELRSKSNSQVAEVAEFIEQKELACSLRKVQVSRASKQWKGDNEPQYQSLVVRLSEASPL